MCAMGVGARVGPETPYRVERERERGEPAWLKGGLAGRLREVRER